MQIVLCGVAALFGALSLAASIAQLRNEKKPFPALMMVIGSVLLIPAVVCNLLGNGWDLALALLGCAAICAAAILNGLKSGQFHWQHHAVRIALSVALLVGFALL